MRRLMFAGLVAVAGFASHAAAQSTTTPQAAPAIPPGETPPAAGRDPQGGADAVSSDQNSPQQPSPNSDPPERRQT